MPAVSRVGLDQHVGHASPTPNPFHQTPYATGSSNDTIMRFQIGGTSAGNYIYFGDSADTNVGMIRYSHSDDSLRFTVNTEERLHIASDGDATFQGNINANGNIVGDNSTAITGIANVTGQNANSLNLLNVGYVGNTTTIPSTSFLHFNDQNVPAFGSGGNFTTLGAVSGLNLVFDTNNNDNNGLVIGSGSTNTSLMTTHMVVSHQGLVGIGNTIPTQKLDVTGNIKVSGGADIDGDLDVDGKTNLDDVAQAGVTTITAGAFANNLSLIHI